jgi:hypothetical protein
MKKINFYSFHKGIAEHRFDHNNSLNLFNELSKSFNVTRYEYDGSDQYEFNGVTINHGSILIFEYDDTKQFKVFDFGDNPYLSVELSKSTKFIGAVLGQYNPKFWDSILTDPIKRKSVIGGIYPETVWQLGILNYDMVHDIRSSHTLDTRLFWRGSLYNKGVPDNYLGIRKSIEHLPNILTDEQLYFGHTPLPFNLYIQESMQFKLALSIGGGGGAICGDFCFRDIEMFGLGIPLIRPTYIVETNDPLIPNFHYIAVDTEFDAEFRYKNHEQLSIDIKNRYLEVINDNELLNFVTTNARDWYIKNLSSPNITTNIIELLNL